MFVLQKAIYVQHITRDTFDVYKVVTIKRIECLIIQTTYLILCRISDKLMTGVIIDNILKITANYQLFF